MSPTWSTERGAEGSARETCANAFAVGEASQAPASSSSLVALGVSGGLQELGSAWCLSLLLGQASSGPLPEATMGVKGRLTLATSLSRQPRTWSCAAATHLAASCRPASFLCWWEMYSRMA